MIFNKKMFLSLVLLGNIGLYASNAKDIYYENGVKDALNILTKKVTKDIKEKKVKHLVGYMAYKDITMLDEVEIIKISAIAMKLGYNIDYRTIKGSDYLIFEVKKRKPDAVAVVDRLKKYKIVARVSKVDTTAKISMVVGENIVTTLNDIITERTLKYKKRIKELENYILKVSSGEPTPFALPACDSKKKKSKVIECNQNNTSTTTPKKVVKIVQLDLHNLQVVNRVVTVKYLKKRRIKAERVEPLNKYAKAHFTVEKVREKNRIVARNIKKNYRKPLPNIRSFSQAYNYISKNGVINKNNILLLNGFVFKEGDKIFNKYVLKRILYKSGVVILDDYHLVNMKKEK